MQIKVTKSLVSRRATNGFSYSFRDRDARLIAIGPLDINTNVTVPLDFKKEWNVAGMRIRTPATICHDYTRVDFLTSVTR